MESHFKLAWMGFYRILIQSFLSEGIWNTNVVGGLKREKRNPHTWGCLKNAFPQSLRGRFGFVLSLSWEVGIGTTLGVGHWDHPGRWVLGPPWEVGIGITSAEERDYTELHTDFTGDKVVLYGADCVQIKGLSFWKRVCNFTSWNSPFAQVLNTQKLAVEMAMSFSPIRTAEHQCCGSRPCVPSKYRASELDKNTISLGKDGWLSWELPGSRFLD